MLRFEHLNRGVALQGPFATERSLMDESALVEFPTQDDLQLDLRKLFLGAIKLALETLLEEELKEMIGAQRYERTKNRSDRRNGTYIRQLITSMGYLDVTVPRSRNQGAPTGVIGEYQRRTKEVDEAIATAYVGGVSTRKMSDVTEALMGEKVGRSTVSRVTKQLDAQVEAFRTARIEDEVVYLFLDATFLKARWARSVENVSALVAYGVGPNGYRRLLGVTIGSEESEDTWADLLKQLLDRGLRGVKLIIADDHRGLTNAARRLLPEAKVQRCTVHLERNVLSHAPKRLRKRLADEVGEIFRAPNRKDAKARLEKLKSGLGAELPEAIACLESGFAAATVFYDFPKRHWKKIRSTNGVERLHGEVKRRINSVGAFPDRASALRLITAVLLQATAIWTDRRYLDVALLGEAEAAA
jgi:putative transposase